MLFGYCIIKIIITTECYKCFVYIAFMEKYIKLRIDTFSIENNE